MLKKIRFKTSGLSSKRIFHPEYIHRDFAVWTMFLRPEFQPERGTFLEKQLDCFELSLDRFSRVDSVDNEMLGFLIIHPDIRNCCVREDRKSVV